MDSHTSSSIYLLPLRLCFLFGCSGLVLYFYKVAVSNHAGMTEVHMCELMRSTEQDEWLVYQDTTYLTIDMKGGVTMRVASSNTLVLDLPASAIAATHVISKTIIRILTSSGSNNKLALKFEHPQSLDLLVRSYETCGVPVCKDAVIDKNRVFSQFMNQDGFPNIHDPAVQEVLLRLLFSAPFDAFVQELEEWLGRTRDRLP